MNESEGGGACTNCGTALAGAYCHACGQRRFVESDRRIGHLLHQFVGSVTDLDGRTWRTLRALLFRPGLLSREYFDGRRARWLAPVSLFLAVSVVYFLAPIRGGDLTAQFNQQVSGHVRALAADPGETLGSEQLESAGPAHAAFTDRWIERRVQKRDARLRSASDGANGYTYRDYRIAYNAKADDVSKALVVLHAPIAALVLLLLFAGGRRYFAEHFVFVLHYFAFWMVALEAVSQFANLVHWLPASWQMQGGVYDWFMRTLLPTYAVLALRRAYGIGWMRALGSAVVLIATIVLFNLYVYHAVQFVITFALT